MKKFLLFSILASFVSILHAQTISLYPGNWWTGMKWNKVQVLVHADEAISSSSVSIKHPGITLQKVNKFQNPKYLALDLLISPSAKTGDVKINFTAAGKTNTVDWPLDKRRAGNGTAFAKGVNSSDLVYLIMPDRFSNGDETNDRVLGMKDQSLRRDTVFNRHGGDLKGVQNHLDYLNDMGVTTIWLNPVLENDMENRTEHGYAITDHYKVDPRLGGDIAYKNLVNAAHAKGMKIIQDAIYNHTGYWHFLFQDMPDSSWFHRWPKFTQTNYKDQVLFDPYAANSDKKIMLDGWFVPLMPDWDHSNLFVEKFLIQHAIWCVEEFGVDGWRIDTYAYNDLNFMNRCNQALYNEYPRISIFGETWVHGVINQAFFCQNKLDIPYKSNLQATTDFQLLFYGIQPALNEKFGWTEGVNKMYTTTAQDIIYKDPMRQVIFLDNHDLSRFYSVVGEDTSKYKMALSWLLTFRGIPQLYYGNEVLMPGVTSPNDGYVRLDFPGGWPGDAANKFIAAGRTEKENDVFNHLSKLANFRKRSSAIKTGRFMQYLPQDGLYVYFRYDNDQTIMCVMNTAETEKAIDFARYTERTAGFGSATDVVSGVSRGRSFSIPAKQMYVMELKK
ncbi:MAG: alpha-amylase family glycosyl hydrolase [Ferruginibacter sp.]